PVSVTSLACSLFFLLSPPPPTPTLFPYTTLFRSLRSARAVVAEPRLVERKLHETLEADPALMRVDLVANAVDETRRVRCLLGTEDRKSTRLNSSHVKISYAVFCLKKKK